MNASELLSVGFISLCATIPIMCWLDLKYRKVPAWIFGALVIINAPITALVYYLGIISLWHLLTSLAICVFAFAVWKVYGAGAFSAADRNLVCCIALFFYWNPFSAAMDPNYANFIAVMYQVKFLVYYVMVLCLMPGCIFALNLGMGMHRDYSTHKGPVGFCGPTTIIKSQTPYTVWEMLTRVPGGIPMILPIAAAFFITAIWGI